MGFSRATFLVVTGIAALVLLSVLPAKAATTPVRNDCPNTIIAGLWQGINDALGTTYGCTNNSSSSSSPSTAQPSQTDGQYAALGDSVAAGLGLPVANNTDAACGVSARAYPTRVAERLGFPYKNLACSGATFGDLVTEQHLPGTSRDIEPQLDRAFAPGKPRLITITAGANDMYWQYFARKCYVGNCGTAADKALLAGLRSALTLKVEYAMQNINFRSNGQPPQVLVTGYYRPLSAACARQVPALKPAEIRWLNNQLVGVNQTLSQAVSRYDFAQFVSIDFTGHELCSSRPWVQGLTSPAPLHPTSAGQRAIADAVARQVR